MSMVPQLVSSEKTDWRTPEDVRWVVRRAFDLLRLNDALVERVDLDPCANRDPANHFATLNYTDDGLNTMWLKRTFMNPPYGRGIDKWIEKAICETALGRAHVIGLVPANTGTRWGQLCLNTAKAVCFWKGRITFDGGDGDPAPFNSMLPFWTSDRRRVLRFAEVMGEHGKVVVL